MVTDGDRSRVTVARNDEQIDAWMRQVRSFAGRFGRELVRNRTVLFWTVAFPVGFYLLTLAVFIDTGEIPDPVVPHVKAGVAVGYGMFGAIIASLNAFGQQLAADFEADRYVQFRSLPLSPAADLVGRMLAGLALSVLSFGAVVGVAMATGATFTLASPLVSPVVIALALTTFAVVWMTLAVLVSVLVREARYASIITVSLALAAYFLTGYNGTTPSDYAGPDIALNLLPNTLATRLVSSHAVAFGEASTLSPPVVPDVPFGLGVLGAYAVGSMLVGTLVMRQIVYKKGVSG